jgi:hypothetical protein
MFHPTTKDGSFGFNFSGSYDEVELYKVISYTLDDGRKVMINFINRERCAEVIETFEVVNDNSIEIQQSGWQAILYNFKKYAEKLVVVELTD